MRARAYTATTAARHWPHACLHLRRSTRFAVHAIAAPRILRLSSRASSRRAIHPSQHAAKTKSARNCTAFAQLMRRISTRRFHGFRPRKDFCASAKWRVATFIAARASSRLASSSAAAAPTRGGSGIVCFRIFLLGTPDAGRGGSGGTLAADVSDTVDESGDPF